MDDPEVSEVPRRRTGEKPPRRLRKGMYILPSLFTTANIAFGYYAILQITHATIADSWHFDNAAKAIGFAVMFDGLDGRMARFNITSNPQPSNPGRPGKKYFVGMPIPAGAGVIAAVVHFSNGDPIASWWTALTWMLMVVAVGYLMVSTWRFYSFKDIDFRSRQPFRLVILFGLLFAAIRFYSQWVLFLIALLYVFSGVFWRLKWIFRRKGNPPPPPAYTEASQTS